MNSQVISEFVKSVASFGPVRAKALRAGKEERLTGASVEVDAESLSIKDSAGDSVEVNFSDIEHIIFSPEKQKYFVHLRDGLVEVRPDQA